MKTTGFTLFLTFALLLFIRCNNSTSSKEFPQPTKKSLLAAVAKFNQAFKTCDLEILDAMVASNYQHSNGSSQAFGKTSWFTYLKKRKAELDAGILVVDRYEMEDVQVELFDDTAILTAKIVVSSTKAGEKKDNAYRVTNVWVYEAGQWKRAGFHDGKIL